MLLFQNLPPSCWPEIAHRNSAKSLPWLNAALPFLLAPALRAAIIVPRLQVQGWHLECEPPEASLTPRSGSSCPVSLVAARSVVHLSAAAKFLARNCT